MLKRLEAVQDGKKAEEMVELNLDNCESEGSIEGIDEQFSSLQNLSLINAGITSLKGFPKLLKLQKLGLKGNNINGGLSSLSGCVSLQHLDLTGNKIDDIDALSPLTDLKKLTELDLFNCAITEQSDYRKNIFKLLPSLHVLDGCKKKEEDQNGKEAEVPQVQVTNDEEEASESDAEEEEESDVESGDEEEVGLSYLEKEDISDDDEDGDYEEESEGEEVEIDEEDDDGEERGVKRKLDEDEEDS